MISIFILTNFGGDFVPPIKGDSSMTSIFDQTEYNQVTFKAGDYRNASIKNKEFSSCKFSRCNFKDADFSGCKFIQCQFVDCDLSLSIHKNCNFNEVTFKNTQLVGINWMDTSLARKGYFRPVEFIGCTLNYGTFIGCYLKSVRMSDCMVQSVDFSEANLSQALCVGSDFSASRFNNTDLTEANFRGARNYAISVIDNKVKKAQFSLPEAMDLLTSLGIVLADRE